MTKFDTHKILVPALVYIFLFLNAQTALGQTQTISGQVIDNISKEPLNSATITFFQQGKTNSLISNKDGKFSFVSLSKIDSVKITMIGYRPAIVRDVDSKAGAVLLIKLDLQTLEMQEVVVKSMTAQEIMEKAAARVATSQPTGNFETSGFYREVIKDRENYFSVAEALFKVQFFPSKDDYKVQLSKGRSKEDVAYTMMFEDYHPGGGPQRAIENSFLFNIPSFLKKKRLKDFTFKKLKSTSYDNKLLYVIEFDQKPGVKEALEKGKIFISGEDFSVVKFEAEASPVGLPYIKHLTGTDKMFAELLKIDFKRKSWKRTVDFVKAGDKWLMNYVDMEFKIAYKQPKKKLDLDLTIAIELLVTPELNAITKEISKDEEWKSKDLVKNLPFAFDSAFWGLRAALTKAELN
jgi:CarboxypepD_reg-like domain